MEDKIVLKIKMVASEGETLFDLHVTKDEYEIIKEIAMKSKRISKNMCDPVLQYKEISAEDNNG